MLKYSNTNNSKVNHKGHNIAVYSPGSGNDDGLKIRFGWWGWMRALRVTGVNNLSKSSRQAFAVCEIEAAFKALIISVDARRDAA